MPTDQEIAAALDPQVSSLSIARRLGCSPSRVRRLRLRLGVPAFRRGRRRAADSWEELYERLSVDVEDGHRRWTGHVTQQRTPVMFLDGRNQTVRRVAFVLAHGREPEGYVRVGCDYQGCVTGEHMRDRAMREGRS